jgi:UPF0755 protein
VLIGAVRVLASAAGPGKGAPISIEIDGAVRPRDVARLLVEAGAARSETIASVYFGVFGDVRKLAAGRHLLDDAWSLVKIRAALERAPDRARARVVIPEGFHRFAIAERLEATRVCAREAFLAATTDPMLLQDLEIPGAAGASAESAEGFLFPATYDLPVDSRADEVVRRLVGEARSRWTELMKRHAEGASRLERELAFGRREIVTLASMVEKETGAPEERPRVASVFLNRLRDPGFTPKLLQSDPTTAYGCVRDRGQAPSCATFEGKVTGEQNRDRLNTYSTYVREGLPPGPIASPGEAALAAVLAPEESAFLYFVANGKGGHRFSKTYEEHLKAVRGEPSP